MLENLQVLNLDEEEKKQNLADRLNQLYSDRVNGKVRITLDGAINEASNIYIDTNFFLKDTFAPPLIELLVSQKHKIRVPITVRHELRCIGENLFEKRGTEEINAVFFGKLIDELNVTIVNDQLSAEQNRIIQSNLCNYDWDFADDHLVELMKLVQGKTILLTSDNRFIDRVNKLSNSGVKIERNFIYNLDRSTYSNKGAGGIRGNRALNQGPKAINQITFIVDDIQLSKTRKSYNILRSKDPKPVISIKITALLNLTTDELKAKLVGKTLKSTSTPSDILKILNS
jgi:predicted nucleic acid-binding protein